MQPAAPVPHCVGHAVFDGKDAEVFVNEVTPHHAVVRAIGAVMLPDRFHLVAETIGVNTPCVVRERRGKLYLVAFA